MADAPSNKREAALRGDFKIKWSETDVGQFPKPDPPVSPIEVGNTIVPVHMYLDPNKIGPLDGIGPEMNDDNNQEEIKKGKAKPIKWYVKIAGGGGDQHHDDYSYHGYPWDGHSSSSSGSCSPPYSSVPTDDTSAGGYPMPPAINSDPSGTISGTDEVAPSAATAMQSQQVQFGGAPPASPSLSQRFNIFPYRTTLLPMALRTFRKLKGISDVQIRFLVKVSDAITMGNSVEMNCTLIPFEGLHAPSNVYRKAFIVDSTYPSGVSGDWREVFLTFRGFDPGQEFPVTFNLARRSDVSPNYNTEVWVMTTQIQGVK